MLNYVDDPKVQSRRWWIITAIGLFTIMSTLDGSIVNIALPVMVNDLHISMNEAEWVASVYLIVICALLLLFGKLGDSIGKIRIFKFGSLLFVLGSFMAGFSVSFWFLILARIVQAVGAAMTMSNNNGIITEVFPMAERGRALGLIGSFVAVGSIAGPGIGGILLAHLPWGYIFWINVPVGLVTIILQHYILPKDVLKSHAPIDWPGFLASVLLIVPLFLGIFIGQVVGFTTWYILLLFVVALVALWLFVHIENRAANPLIVLSLFKNHEFTISLMTAFLIFVTNFFFNVLSPFYLQNARGLAPNYAGYILMIFPLVQVVVAPIAGSVADRIGPYGLTLAGLGIITLSQIAYALLDLHTSWWFIMLAIGAVGVGNGMFQAPNNTIVMSSVEPQHLGVAGGMNALARNLGMVVGISAATTILFGRMSAQAGKKVTSYQASDPQLFIDAMHTVFWVATAIAIVAFILTAQRYFAQRRA